MQALNSSQNSNGSINNSSSDEGHQQQHELQPSFSNGNSTDVSAASSICENSMMSTSCNSGENSLVGSSSHVVESHVANNQQHQQHINNNSIAINNNNCDIKNNNQVTALSQLPPVAATSPIDVNEAEAAAPLALIDQQNAALLRGVNMGEQTKHS